MDKEKQRSISQNKKAYYDYFVEETFEAGIELFGTEVKSLRLGAVNMKDAYCFVEDGEIFVKGMHISPYEKGNIFNKDPLRDRRLLMHKREIIKLGSQVKKGGYTLVALSLYFSHGKVKLKLGLCKGKKLYDKRDDLSERTVKRETERTVANISKYGRE